MDSIRSVRDNSYAVNISDPRPLDNVGTMWQSAGRAATIGIFLLLFVAFLYVSRGIIMPLLAAAVVALSLSPLMKRAKAHGIPPWIASGLIVVFALGALGIAATALAAPMSEWISRAPEIGATIQDRLSVLQRPLASLKELEGAFFGSGAGTPGSSSASDVVVPVVAFLTPAAGELLLFFGALLFFLVGQSAFRSNLVALFAHRDSKLRFLKIMNDIEHNLTSYLTLVTIINAALGIIVAIGAWIFGLPNPVIFGVLAAVLNYVPYVGPAIMVIALFGVGLISFPSLGQAVIAPLAFVVLTATEGHVITPAIIGRRMTLNPLLILLALAFWTWMWGPVGSLLAAPLSIIELVIFNHLFPATDMKLPD